MFKVQILRWGFWVTVQELCDNPTGADVYCHKTFGNYQSARMWVDDIGLSKAYKEQSPYKWWLLGGVMEEAR